MHSSASEAAQQDPSTTDPGRHDATSLRLSAVRGDSWCYVAVVILGAALIVVTAIRQPFSYDELQQIAPYASDDYDTITGATRQPPLDPLLGALLHHVFGQGQLQDRLVPVLAGIGSLIAMSLLLRRFGLRYAGAFAVLVMATAPLMLRYSAYTRPYMLPMFMMLLMTLFVHAWLADGRRRWLVGTAVAAVVLPLIRVPEPTVFLIGTAGIVSWYAVRRRLTWRRAWPVAAIATAAVLTMGLTQYFALASSASGFFDPSPSGVIDRFPEGVHELVTAFVPLLGEAFPWWPVTLLVLVATVAIPASRRQLVSWPMWWPLLAAPVAFAIAYHFVNPVSFDALPYRARAASFFVPAFVLAVAALASVVERSDVTTQVRAAAGVLVVATFVTQLPASSDVVRKDAAPDFGAISAVLTSQVPDDAIVLYDRPTPAGASRQPFLGRPRYMGDTPVVNTVAYIPSNLDDLPTEGPVYLLFNGQCAYPGRCVPGKQNAVDVHIAGWHIAYQHERFTLYAPDDGQSGRDGVIEAMKATRDALGVELGYLQTYAAAALLADSGKRGQAEAMVRQMFHAAASQDPDMPERIRHEVDQYDLDPFQLDPEADD